MPTPSAPIHGTVISFHGGGCLITGASGTGKSRLAQEAMMMGAKLVADDRVILQTVSGFVTAAPVHELTSIMEIRGLGIIRVSDALARQVLHLVVELDPNAPNERLPEPGQVDMLGVKLPILRLPPAPNTPVAGLLLYLRAMQQGGLLPHDWRPERSPI